MLAERGIELDVVIELVVDDKALVGRILKRAEEAKAAGEAVRKDDNAEVFDERLREYYKKTAPLIGYYYAKGLLKTRRRHGQHGRGHRRRSRRCIDAGCRGKAKADG